MNRGIIKIFKQKIYNTDFSNNPQKYINNILYFIYLITFIMKKLFKKKRKYEIQRKR